jgi:hypothetical protein
MLQIVLYLKRNKRLPFLGVIPSGVMPPFAGSELVNQLAQLGMLLVFTFLYELFMRGPHTPLSRWFLWSGRILVISFMGTCILQSLVTWSPLLILVVQLLLFALFMWITFPRHYVHVVEEYQGEDQI